MAPIYTKTGDAGLTGLFGGGRVPKDDARVEAYGDVDELNAAVGLARSLSLDVELDGLCQAIQDQLFTLGAMLATPKDAKARSALPPLKTEWVTAMERAIDKLDAELEPLRAFIHPGGTSGASALHLARTICRRAERRVVRLVREGDVENEAVVYLNRLSDFLFTLARIANRRANVPDVAWKATPE